MGLDGFSMGNLGLNVELTSAQMAAQSEQIANKDAEILVKKLEESSEGQLIKRKDEKSKEKGKNPNNKNKNEEDNEDSEGNDEPVVTPPFIGPSSQIKEKFFEKENLKDFSLRINTRTGLVELFNNKDKNILESINAEDLMKLMSKLDNASGVLVNRKI